MLNYQSTSYHDIASVRELVNLRPAPEFAVWLERWGILRHGKLASPDESLPQRLLAPLEKSLA
jgi:ethanolamine ammonia-lyase large subunit